MTDPYQTRRSGGEETDIGMSREALILKYTPYVKRIVGRIAAQLPPGTEMDDLIHAGVIGLIEALDRYDASRENAFITFATFRIRGAVLSELRARDVCPRSSRRRLREMKATSEKLEGELGRPAEAAEVAAAMGISMDEYHGIRTRAAVSIVSFEDLGWGSRGDRRRMIREIADADGLDALEMAGMKELVRTLAQAIEALPHKDRLVISLYYQDELTMKEIGRVLDISESRVSQLHARAVISLRETLTEAGLIGTGGDPERQNRCSSVKIPAVRCMAGAPYSIR